VWASGEEWICGVQGAGCSGGGFLLEGWMLIAAGRSGGSFSSLGSCEVRGIRTLRSGTCPPHLA
jgi:hypothetical protein